MALQFGHDAEVVDNSHTESRRNGMLATFNSATTLRSWITAQPVSLPSVGSVLQFGHDAEVVDNHPSREGEAPVDTGPSIRPRR